MFLFSSFFFFNAASGLWSFQCLNFDKYFLFGIKSISHFSFFFSFLFLILFASVLFSQTIIYETLYIWFLLLYLHDCISDSNMQNAFTGYHIVRFLCKSSKKWERMRWNEETFFPVFLLLFLSFLCICINLYPVVGKSSSNKIHLILLDTFVYNCCLENCSFWNKWGKDHLLGGVKSISKDAIHRNERCWLERCA